MYIETFRAAESFKNVFHFHYNDVIMSTMASQITSLTIVYSTVYSHADQRKHQSSASLAFVRGIHRGPVNSPHKWPVTRKMFPFDDVIIFVVIIVPADDLSAIRCTSNLHIQWWQNSVPVCRWVTWRVNAIVQLRCVRVLRSINLGNVL